MWSEIKNLANVPKEEQRSFLNSFDHVLCDMDGVIWITFKPIQYAPECITNLKKIGKKVNFVTNNTTIRTKDLHQFLQKFNFPVNKEDVVTPTIAYIEYLQQNNFNKQIYVLGGQGLKDDLVDAGFKLAPISANPIEETLPAVTEALSDNEDVGAVIMDFDINLTAMKLQKCLTYLKRDDCLFLIGTADKTLPFPKTGPLIGNYYYLELLKDISGRQPLQMSKPSVDFNNLVNRKFCIKDPCRVLFIGDSINEDMKFAGTAGYKKLLVLTGGAKKEDVLKWTHGEVSKPDYYVDSLGALNLILGMLLNN